MATFEVTSEIYRETNFQSKITKKGRTISKFTYFLPNEDVLQNDELVTKSIKIDKDGDLVLPRRLGGVLEIEHMQSTMLKLVGLQVWRGALLLADYILHYNKMLKNRKILELGSGIGLTSIIAGIYAQEVICTDIDVGGLLTLIKSNVRRNSVNGNIAVLELDFKKEWSPEIRNRIRDVEIIFAADVIYDDDLTEAFVHTIEKLCLELNSLKTIFIALEKRYVFTVSDLDTTAPCYEYFLEYFKTMALKHKSHNLKLKVVDIKFPQYFMYERIDDLVLLEIEVGVLHK